MCNYVYGTKWEMNRHLKNKHGLKLVENDAIGVNQWEVSLAAWSLIPAHVRDSAIYSQTSCVVIL